jgi:aspartokinase
METISSVVKGLIDHNPFLLEAMARGILSYGNLAAELMPQVEKRLEKPVKDSAIVMALRRYGDEIRQLSMMGSKSGVSCEIVMKTNICDFNVAKTPGLLDRLQELYSIANLNRGDFLNVSIGSDEISIVISDKYADQVREFLAGDTIQGHKTGLVSLTLLFEDDFIETPGVVYQAVRRLAWERINVYEIVSTMTELTVVVDCADSLKGYEVLQDFIAEREATEN